MAGYYTIHSQVDTFTWFPASGTPNRLAQPAAPRPAAKGHGNTWTEEDMALMMQLVLLTSPDRKGDDGAFSGENGKANKR